MRQPDCKRRVGVFGGSFNPIHLAHTQIALRTLETGLIDELWLLVSPQNPLKRDANLLPDELRLRMAKAATADYPTIHVSDFEFSLPRPSYMVNTLLAMEQAYPDRAFTLIIGADNWLRFPQWYRYQDILARYPVIIYPREGYPIQESSLPSQATYLQMPLLNISATQIRQDLQAHRDTSAWLHPSVAQILKQQPLHPA